MYILLGIRKSWQRSWVWLFTHHCHLLTMLLWWAFVIRSILPTRSVVETPWVRLHSLEQQQVVRHNTHTHRAPTHDPTHELSLFNITTTLSSGEATHLYLPDFFTSSYVSFPSTVSVMSSEMRHSKCQSCPGQCYSYGQIYPFRKGLFFLPFSGLFKPSPSTKNGLSMIQSYLLKVI